MEFFRECYDATEFSTNLILKGETYKFSKDHIVRLLSLLDVKEPSFPIIPFKFKNLTFAFFRTELSLVVEHDILKIVYQLVLSGHSYGGGSLTINIFFSSHLLNYVVMAVIHPYLHHH